MADTEPMDAEGYLRSKYGAYRGHPEWRALEAAFNAGRATLPPPRNAPEEELRVAAGDVLKRWDSPLWREESTAELMGRLRAALASRPAEVDDWISVEDRLPGKERCLAAYVNAMGKHRIIRAMYADQFQIDAGEDAIDQGNCEYNEADDTFYLKAGWLECIDNWDDYSSIYVTEGTVTHWRRLPASPSHTTNKETGNEN